MRRYNGGVRNIGDLMGRCVVDIDTGCWHLRDSMGRRIARSAKACPTVFCSTRQAKVSARRLSHELRNGPVKAHHRVTYTCHSWDCMLHTQAMSRATLGTVTTERGDCAGPAKAQALRLRTRQRGIDRGVLTDELAQWVRESSQVQTAIGHALGIAQARVSDIQLFRTWRPIGPAATVFDWRGL